MINKARKVLDLAPIEELYQETKFSEVVAQIHQDNCHGENYSSSPKLSQKIIQNLRSQKTS